MKMNSKKVKVGDYITTVRSFDWHNGTEELIKTFVIIEKRNGCFLAIDQFHNIDDSFEVIADSEIEDNFRPADRDEKKRCKKMLIECINEAKKRISRIEKSIGGKTR